MFAEIREWQPAPLGEPTTWVLIGLTLVAVAIWRRHPSWRLALPTLAFTAMGLTSSRNLTVASLVIVALVARERPSLGSLASARAARPILRPVLVLAGVLLAVAALARPDVNLNGYPVDAVDWMEDQRIVGEEGDPQAHIASRDFVGNYLEARYGTDARVFIDDRYDMYPVELSLDYVGLVDGVDVLGALERHEVNVVLWERESDVADALEASGAWHTVYEDEDWFVACDDVCGAFAHD